MQSTEILDYQSSWRSQVDLLYNLSIYDSRIILYYANIANFLSNMTSNSQQYISHNKRTVNEEDFRLCHDFGISIVCIKVTRIIVQISLAHDLPSKFTLSKDVVMTQPKKL